MKILVKKLNLYLIQFYCLKYLKVYKKILKKHLKMTNRKEMPYFRK